jgi:hypothetical protein
MMTRTIALILTLTLATLAHSKCPNIQPVEGLSLTNWTQSTWYIAQQQLNGYQKKEDLYCTLATYDLNRSQHIPFFKGDVVSVHNYQNVNEINGKVQNTDINIPSGLCARLKNESLASKLLVAPCFLPNFAAGPCTFDTITICFNIHV